MTAPKPKPIISGPVKFESLVPVIAELERAVVWAYNLTGSRPAGSSKIVVVVQTRGQKKNCLGSFRQNGWETKEGELVHEISLSAESLNRPVLEVIGTTIHETCHLWNADMDIRDCSDGGRHNGKFKDTAEMMGLVVSQGTQGWSDTVMGEDLSTKVEKGFKPDYDAFRLARAVIVRPTKEPSMSKWQCEEGCTIIRASKKVEVQAVCGKCSQSFQREVVL